MFWPNIQKDISNLIEQCQDCQIHANKKPRPAEHQVSATRALDVLGMDLMEFRGVTSLVTVDYFSELITFDPLERQDSDAVIKALNTIFRKIGPPERIISDNGPCFKSEKFNNFCKELEIQHDTSSPHHHQSNGRAERAIQTIKKILKKCKSETEITLALLAYHDTPVSDTLPSPAELFFNRSNSHRIVPPHPPSVMTDLQSAQLSDKRSQHLKPTTTAQQFVPNQPIWFTEDGTPEWKPGFIESKDVHSYWIINKGNNRRLR